MAESTVPGPGPVTVNEASYESLMHPAGGDGFVGMPGGQAPVYGDSSGRQVKVRAGVSALLRGSLWRSGDTDFTVPIVDNSSGLTRIDRVVVRLNRATWLATVVAITGTPGSGAPDLTRDVGATGFWDLPAARVTVANGAAIINGGDVVREDYYLGEPPILYTTATRPTTARTGQLGYNTDLKEWQQYDGAQWTSLIPAMVANSERWNGFRLSVQSTTPAGSPTADRVWFQTT